MSAAFALGCAGLGLGCSSSVRSAAAFRCAARRLHSTSRGGRERCERSRLVGAMYTWSVSLWRQQPGKRPSQYAVAVLWWPISRSRREPKSSCCVLTLHAMPQRILFLRERHAPDSPQASPASGSFSGARERKRNVPLTAVGSGKRCRFRGGRTFGTGRETPPIFSLSGCPPLEGAVSK